MLRIKNFKHLLLTLLFSILVTSCATTGQSIGVRKNSLPQISEAGTLSDGYGILLMSAGRKQKAAKEDGTNFAGILPFVSYHLLRKTSGLEYEELAFIPAEAGFSNQLDKGYYGFVHYRELPAGEYLAIGNESRGGSLYAGGVILGPGNRTTDIAFTFIIEANKVNYVGELMTMKGFLRNEDIRVLDAHTRDVEFLYAEHNETREIPLSVQLAKPADFDDLPIPEVLQ